MRAWRTGRQLEDTDLVSRFGKRVLFDTIINNLPSPFLRALSDLSGVEPGAWSAMVASYDEGPSTLVDKVLLRGNVLSMALRNRKKLASEAIVEIIDTARAEPAHTLCLGAGPGHIILDAMTRADSPSEATLVDRSAEAVHYGRRISADLGLEEQVTYVLADVRRPSVYAAIDQRVDLIKMIGICEYLTDGEIVSTIGQIGRMMDEGGAVVTNSFTTAHGLERCFQRLGFEMRYRSDEHMSALLALAGFKVRHLRPEPLGIYSVVVAHKVGPAVPHVM